MRKAPWLLISLFVAFSVPLRAETGAASSNTAPRGPMTINLLTALEESGDANFTFDHAARRGYPQEVSPGPAPLSAPLGSPQLSRALNLVKPGVKTPDQQNRGRLKDNSGLAFGVMAVGGGLGAWGGVVLAGLAGVGGPAGILLCVVLGTLGFWGGASLFNHFFPS